MTPFAFIRPLRPHRSGFTLIELMISVALVVVLMLGINQIFGYTSKAVGTGESLNAGIRISRAASATFKNDFDNLVAPGIGPTDSACMILQSSATLAFTDKADQLSSSRLANPTLDINPLVSAERQIDLDNDGTAGDGNGEVVGYSTYNRRNHRTDTFSFFARGNFQRQTGNDGQFVSPMQTQEAWIWYGHLNVRDTGSPNFAGTSGWAGTLPGQGSSPADNPYNFFASQFTLGRVAILLRDFADDSNHDGIPNTTNPQYVYWRRNSYVTDPTKYESELEPLSTASQARSSPSSLAPIYPDLAQSRFDLAATSISAFRQKLHSYLSDPSNSFRQVNWPLQLMTPNGPASTSRFICNPFAGKPLSAASMAQATPAFLPGCSQFIVEYAGDYMVQDLKPTSATYGGISKKGQDGEIDFVVLKDPINGNVRKQIIWYGMPRSTSGNGTIDPYNAGDVAPLSWWLSGISTFEKSVPKVGALPVTTLLNNPTGPLAPYICAWSNSPSDVKPKLIRITLTLEDPNGRLTDGLTYQYVFRVP